MRVHNLQVLETLKELLIIFLYIVYYFTQLMNFIGMSKKTTPTYLGLNKLALTFIVLPICAVWLYEFCCCSYAAIGSGFG